MATDSPPPAARAHTHARDNDTRTHTAEMTCDRRPSTAQDWKSIQIVQ